MLLKPSENGKTIEIVTEALNYEVSCELCDDIENKTERFRLCSQLTSEAKNSIIL